MTSTRISLRIRSVGLAMAAACLACVAPAALAQGLDTKGAVETIVGSEVDKVETSAVGQQVRIVKAIKNSRDSTDKARKLINAEKISIVSVTASETETAAIDAAVEGHADEVAELRQAIEGSAILFHAIDSQDIMLRNVVAMEISDGGEVAIFATENRPSN